MLLRALVVYCLTGLGAAAMALATPALSEAEQGELDLAVIAYESGQLEPARVAFESLARRQVPAAEFNLAVMH